MRDIIYSKTKGRCYYCGEELKKGWHVDHFKPVKRYKGKMTSPENDNIENLVPSCPSCNVMKASMDIETFRWLISNFVTRLNRDITIYKHAKKYGLIIETGKSVKFYYEEMEQAE